MWPATVSRWLREGVAVLCANTAQLRFSSAVSADSGNYACQAYNRWGIATSEPALLEVDDIGGEPVFLQHPRSADSASVVPCVHRAQQASQS
jgi:hypothetical protein